MSSTKKIYKKAQKLGVCPLFKGAEDADELICLFLTKQGVEFCTKYKFPDIDTLRTFKGAQTENKGIYIDCKKVVLKNVPKVVLIGDTIADLTYNDTECPYEVILMHGATAKITASGYSVVFVTNAGGRVLRTVKDNAKVLW
jgi:hypothetical protein